MLTTSREFRTFLYERLKEWNTWKDGSAMSCVCQEPPEVSKQDGAPDRTKKKKKKTHDRGMKCLNVVFGGLDIRDRTFCVPTECRKYE